MKQLLTLFLAIMFTVPAAANDRKAWIVNSVMETGHTIMETSPVFYHDYSFGGEDYPGAIPGADNFWDYQTNGSSLTSILAFGDTIIVAYPAVDSTDPTGLTTRISNYILSFDGGSSWGIPVPLSAIPNRSGYPDMSTYIGSVGRGLTITGRKYNAGSSRGGAYTDAALGLGSISSENVPFGGRDYFGHYQNGTLIAGVYSNPSGSATTDPDTLKYVRYNYETNTFGSPQQLAVHGDGSIYLNVRYRHVASFNGQTQFVMWWCPDPSPIVAPIDSLDEMNYRVSTDAGNTWSPTTLLQKNLTVNSFFGQDTCGPWFGMDAQFKPNTQEYAAVWSTLAPSVPSGGGLNTARNGGCKILYWNPTVNGGIPVEVAGKNNMALISDTSLFFNRASLQVGVTPVSHPSLAYTQDGNMIVVAFSAFTPGDTVVNTNPAAEFNFTNNDIWTTFSTNNGATWSTPINRTNTPGWDELYPILSETGNSSSKFHLKFQATRLPGSQSFTDVVNTARVYTVYRAINPTTGIEVNPIGTSIPAQFDLKQNFPNPFNPTTNIRFDLSKNANVTLKVYDILGKEVATLLNNETITAGSKEVKFDAVNLSSGIYFYTLTAGNFTSTKKMMLMK